MDASDKTTFDMPMPTLSEEDKAECQRCIDRKGVEGYLEYLRSAQEKWKTIPLNIAILGNSGVGKSSFINAIRGLTADDDGAAEVGVVETTREPTAYPHPNNALMKFWDMPGVGTPKFPKDEYMAKIQVDKFDFFLLLSAERFTEDDARIGQEISQRNKKYYYIRTKIGITIKNDKKAHPRTHNEIAVMNKIRCDATANIKHVDTPVFLIDNHKRQRYDFSKLEQSLVSDFPELKRSALIMSMSAFSKDIVELKVKELRSGIWRTAALSAAVGFVPLPGVSFAFDTALVLLESKFYQHQLGLDEESLKRLSIITSKDLARLWMVDITTSFLVQCIPESATVATCSALEEVFRTIPIIGWLFAAPLSYGTTYYVLSRVLNKLEKTAIEVMNAVHGEHTDESH